MTPHASADAQASFDPRLSGLVGQVKGFMAHAEGLALYRLGLLAGASGLGPLLEIGTYCAKSAIYLGEAARQIGTVLFSVDHHRGSEEMQPGWEHHDPGVVDPRSGRIDTLAVARTNLAEAGLEPYVIMVVGESSVVAAHWATPLSLLFIDGGHGQRVAWTDYRCWTSAVAPGGFLAIHDVFSDPSKGGRPPFEIFCAALASGLWQEQAELAEGSLRVLRRLGCHE